MQIQIRSLRHFFTLFCEVTRIEFSLFGLPFLLAGCLLPFRGISPLTYVSWKWALVLPAFLAARSAGMLFNQWTDAAWDGLNPRTQGRAIPSGRLSPEPVRILAWLFLLLFLALCFLIHPLCGVLGIVAAILIALYAYSKRFSWGCHFVLGAIHALGPIMAAVAVSGKWVPSSVWIGLTAAWLIASNDMLYAVQDEAFDRAHRLHSAPARWGLEPTLRVAKILSFLATLSLLGLAVSGTLHPIFFAAPPIFALQSLDFHQKMRQYLLNPQFLPQVPVLFKRANITSGTTIFFFVLLGMLL